MHQPVIIRIIHTLRKSALEVMSSSLAELSKETKLRSSQEQWVFLSFLMFHSNTPQCYMGLRRKSSYWSDLLMQSKVAKCVFGGPETFPELMRKFSGNNTLLIPWETFTKQPANRKVNVSYCCDEPTLCSGSVGKAMQHKPHGFVMEMASYKYRALTLTQSPNSLCSPRREREQHGSTLSYTFHLWPPEIYWQGQI